MSAKNATLHLFHKTLLKLLKEKNTYMYMKKQFQRHSKTH